MKRTAIIALTLWSALTVLYSAEFTGEDVLWRPREHLIFYFDNASGKGFDVNITCRDQDIYMQKERPLYAFVAAPDGTVANIATLNSSAPGAKLDVPSRMACLPSDARRGGGKAEYADGYADIWMDCRHREYRRKNGLSNKKRAPQLAAPAAIPARRLDVRVPDGMPGIYRVVIASSFDHYISLSTSRKMPCGVHPGQGTLSLINGSIDGTMLYVPPSAGGVAVGVIEEEEPFNWRAQISGGGKKCATTPRRFFNTAHLNEAPRGSVMRLNVSGKTPGAHLAINGIPFILAADDAAVRKFAMFRDGSCEVIALAANEPGTSRELGKKLRRIAAFGRNFSFADSDAELRRIDGKQPWPFLRSSWWPLNDGAALLEIAPDYPRLPVRVRRAICNIAEQWAAYRITMEQGLCTNQWTYDLAHMAEIAHFTGSKLLEDVLRCNVRRLCRVESLGRSNPGENNFSRRHPADSGTIDSGIMAENLGHDSEYNLESNANLAKVWELYRMPEIVENLDVYFRLKTHLTMPRNGKSAPKAFLDTCSPTDINSRTRYYTHKIPGGAILDHVKYGDLWRGKPGKEDWPCLEEGKFVRNFSDRFIFVKTGQYYAILYGGPPSEAAVSWGNVAVREGSFELTGASGCGYGMRQERAIKSGGLSALFVPGAGPMLLGNNHDVMYSGGIWGRLFAPRFATGVAEVDPRITAESYADAAVKFDMGRRIMYREGVLPGTQLKFERTLELKEDEIRVSVKLTAGEGLKLEGLYEGVPIYPDRRKLWGEDGAGRRVELPRDGEFAVKRLYSEAAGGILLKIELDRERKCVMAPVIKYRDIAAGMSGIGLGLPGEWRRGEIQTIDYTLKIVKLYGGSQK